MPANPLRYASDVTVHLAPRRRARTTSSKCRRSLKGWATVALLAGIGCGAPLRAWWPAPEEPPADSSPVSSADNPFLAAPGAQPAPAALRSAPRTAALSVVHVKAPARRAPLLEAVWGHLREDLLGSDTYRHLMANGIRVGKGHADEWNAIRAIIDGIPDCRVNMGEPVNLPALFPLDLELDLEPRDQTIFFLDRFGVLSGATWPASRNVLRVAYGFDPQDHLAVQLVVTPQVRQQATGKRWVRTDLGLSQVTTHRGRGYGELAVGVTLREGEFLVLAPNERAGLSGLIGRAFMREVVDDEAFDSLIFIRPAIADATSGQ